MVLCLFGLRKMLDDDDIGIPEFMTSFVCGEPGCTRRAIPKVGKCLECAFEDALPKLYDDLDEITRTSSSK